MVDYRGEIESDLSVLHRVDSLEAIDGPRFFRLVEQLAYYDGALRGRLRVEMSQRQGSAQPASPAATAAPLPDISEFVGVSGPNSQGQPWIEYRGGAQ